MEIKDKFTKLHPVLHSADVTTSRNSSSAQEIFLLVKTSTVRAFLYETRSECNLKSDLGLKFHISCKSHFDSLSVLGKCSHELGRSEFNSGLNFILIILTEVKFPTAVSFLCKHQIPAVT